jgi:hypothetical protein
MEVQTTQGGNPYGEKGTFPDCDNGGYIPFSLFKYSILTVDSMVAETTPSTVSTESAMPEETNSTAESASSFEPVIELPIL